MQVLAHLLLSAARQQYASKVRYKLIFLASADSEFVTRQTIAVDGWANNT